jgi:hypothetical protein
MPIWMAKAMPTVRQRMCLRLSDKAQAIAMNAAIPMMPIIPLSMRDARRIEGLNPGTVDRVSRHEWKYPQAMGERV